MKRRSFVKASLLTGTAAAIMPAASLASSNLPKTEMEFYELRIYSLKNAAQQKLVEDYFKTAAIPALNRLSVKPIGVFTELKPVGQTKIYVLLPYKSMDDFITIPGILDMDTIYKTGAADYLNAPPADPAYIRIESSLFKAFDHMPKIEVPAPQSRIFELRQYQSASEGAGKKKIDMFNNLGEIDIFKRLGFNPVFFGETIIGSSRPNLTYMLTFDNMDGHDRLWKAFGGDAKWKEIKATPGYSDAEIVSKITSTFLTPTDFSQI
jgi:hypothetical protein